MTRPRQTSSGLRAKANVVLLVEPSPGVRASLAEYLAREGLAVVEAGDGPEALELAVAVHPDVLVTDLFLPTLDGLSLVQRLRAAESTRHISVLGLVGRTTDVAPLRAAGFDVTLRKPCGPRLLLERMRGLLAREASGRAPTEGCARFPRIK